MRKMRSILTSASLLFFLLFLFIYSSLSISFSFLHSKSIYRSDDDQDDGGQIYIIAATCRPDLIDAALLRPGRIEKHFYIGLPSAPDMYEVLCSHLRTFECDEDVKR
jgi:SpoVK/Ycf46/Vps4 family AAA+-type ATPase